MTTHPLRHALIALHTALGTWDRYPYGVHYCATCDALYDYWLGAGRREQAPADRRVRGRRLEITGCGRAPHATLAAMLRELVEVVRP